ncbi:MAG: hypothetical protein J7556_14945 [Acidovorax sp.]|nr:hypothetical protein [Acidovorax sp.]
MVLSDAEIERLILLEKTVANPKAKKLEKRGSVQVNYDAEAETGERFRIYVRQNMRIPEGFSCGLLYTPPSGEPVTLTRYNGSDHEHANPLDGGGSMPAACHIHRATERYMRAGRKAEHFAETTGRYTNLEGALRALIQDCNIKGLSDNSSDPTQLPLL